MIYGEGAYADVLRAEGFGGRGVAWIAQQTRLNPDGSPRNLEALGYVDGLCGTFPNGTLVVVSTQLPVGSCARLEETHPHLWFAVQPENIRPGSGNTDLAAAGRIVVGCRWERFRSLFEELFAGFGPVLWMSPESAEMVKHALNAYLALTVAFGNEIGRLCEAHGADAGEVVKGLRLERRVSDQAPLVPGPPPSEHLIREVHNLLDLGAGPLVKALLW